MEKKKKKKKREKTNTCKSLLFLRIANLEEIDPIVLCGLLVKNIAQDSAVEYSPKYSVNHMPRHDSIDRVKSSKHSTK
jgi:hypothetical protein